MHRLNHNLELRKQWFAKRNIRVGVPPIREQLPTAIVNKHALFPYGYNPSIIQWKGRILMAYRYHPNGAGASKLAMAELDSELRVTTNIPIDIPLGATEDPRLFTYGDNLCISYVVSTMPNRNPTCVIRWGVLKEGKTWTVEGQWLINYGKNDNTSMEKNWVFHEEEGALKVIYQTCPVTEKLSVDQEKVMAVDRKNQLARWKWGGIRGGTVPLRLSNGRQFRFFHSRLDNEPVPTRWRYYVGAMLLDGEGNIQAVSRRPILKGSEYDDLAVTEAASCSHRKMNVVFPLGVMKREDHWLLSVGINDCQCGLVTVKEENLNF